MSSEGPTLFVLVDASVQEDKAGWAAGLWLNHLQGPPAEVLSGPSGPFVCSYSAEAEGMLAILHTLAEREVLPEKVVIGTDSLSLLSAMPTGLLRQRRISHGAQAAL